MLHQIIAGFLALIFFAGPGFAQGANCGDHDTIVERLAAQYGETRQNMGLNQNNSIVEIFASGETGTWTILVTMPSGMACLVAAGQNWEVVAGGIAPTGSPA